MIPSSLGAQLSPSHPAPPPPELDPREPSPSATTTRRGQRTPVKARSPAPSRTASPTRAAGNMARTRSSDGNTATPIHSPIPRTLSPGSASGLISPSSTGQQPIPHPAHSAAHLSRSSSPSGSMHSSSSAIFERDIEQLPPVGALSLNPNPPSQTLNHKSSRLSHLSHGSVLDNSVPSVLDDAVEALQSDAYISRGGAQSLVIEAPAPSGIGMARQSSASLAAISPRKVSSGAMSASRSPSPVSIASGKSSIASPAQSPPIHSQLQHQASLGLGAKSASGSASPSSTFGGPAAPGGTMTSAGVQTGLTPESVRVLRPSMAPRMSTGPQVPGGWMSSWNKEEEEQVSAPAGVATSAPPAGPSPLGVSSPSEAGAVPAAGTPSSAPPPAIPSHLTPTKDKRRISYLSYNDLLLSVPTTTTTLEDIQSGNMSPDHMPGTVSPNVPTRSPVIPTSPNAPSGLPRESEADLLKRPSWDASGSNRGGLGFGDGEWGREGLGKGLEQRLEDLVHSGH